jgi:hypothetical protein
MAIPGLIPAISIDIPSDAVAVYNGLVGQINTLITSAGIVTAPQFADAFTGALSPAQFAAQILILVELRVQNNIALINLGNNATDLEQMRADELMNLVQTTQFI